MTTITEDAEMTMATGDTMFDTTMMSSDSMIDTMADTRGECLTGVTMAPMRGTSLEAATEAKAVNSEADGTTDQNAWMFAPTGSKTDE